MDAGKDQPLKTLQPYLDNLEVGCRRQRVKKQMAANKNAKPLKTLQPFTWTVLRWGRRPRVKGRMDGGQSRLSSSCNST
jgi:hypothetical protein